MSIDGYYLSKLSAGVGCLVGLGDIRTRVEYAFASMTTIEPGELTNKEIGAEYQAMFDRCTSQEAENKDEGRLRATLRHMSDEDVAAVADKILELYTRLFMDRAPDALM